MQSGYFQNLHLLSKFFGESTNWKALAMLTCFIYFNVNKPKTTQSGSCKTALIWCENNQKVEKSQSFHLKRAQTFLASSVAFFPPVPSVYVSAPADFLPSIGFPNQPSRKKNPYSFKCDDIKRKFTDSGI